MKSAFPVLVVVAFLGACTDQIEPTPPPAAPDPPNDEAPSLTLGAERHGLARTKLSGGALTVFDTTVDAFSQPAPNLVGLRLARHEEGDEGFEAEFSAEAGSANPGLGPVFNNIACEACHEGDGRGRPPRPGEDFESLLFRASLQGPGPNGGPRPVPGFGLQLQLRAISPLLPEAEAAVRYVDSAGTFSDGFPFVLQSPRYQLAGTGRPLPRGLKTSPRAAPAIVGLGLLEAVPEGAIFALAARQAARTEVRGKPNIVWDEIRGRPALGRFGWKANVASLLQQNAGAYNGDMGITTSVFPAESCERESPACARHPIEVTDQTLADVTLYTQTLGVPARRSLDDPTATRGELLFHRTGCAQCHVSTLFTGYNPRVPEVSNQVIHPYTDLLVHDMGPGLADNRRDFLASGREWRTAPLWGIGLVERVNGHSRFLHDGRARDLTEAILWHGGEAGPARERFRRLSAADRAALIVFLKSL